MGGRLCISAPCSAVSWDDATAFVARKAGKAETCMDNLVLLESKIV